MPFKIVTPKSVPSGFTITSAVGNVHEGIAIDGEKENDPGSFGLNYTRGQEFIDIGESFGTKTDVPYGQTVHVGGTSMMYSSGNGVSWFDPSSKIVINLTGNVGEGILKGFAREMVGN